MTAGLVCLPFISRLPPPVADERHAPGCLAGPTVCSRCPHSTHRGHGSPPTPPHRCPAWGPPRAGAGGGRGPDRAARGRRLPRVRAQQGRHRVGGGAVGHMAHPRRERGAHGAGGGHLPPRGGHRAAGPHRRPGTGALLPRQLLGQGEALAIERVGGGGLLARAWRSCPKRPPPRGQSGHSGHSPGSKHHPRCASGCGGAGRRGARRRW